MRIIGEWLLCNDGVTRPTVRVKVLGADGTWYLDIFLIDSGADRTVFSADLLRKLGFVANPSLSGGLLQGITGGSSFVEVDTVVEFTRDDGGPAHVRGQYAGFTDPAATDMSILGRDVLNNFDLSRRRNEIWLLAPNHSYHITSP